MLHWRNLGLFAGILCFIILTSFNITLSCWTCLFARSNHFLFVFVVSAGVLEPYCWVDAVRPEVVEEILDDVHLVRWHVMEGDCTVQQHPMPWKYHEMNFHEIMHKWIWMKIFPFLFPTDNICGQHLGLKICPLLRWRYQKQQTSLNTPLPTGSRCTASTRSPSERDPEWDDVPAQRGRNVLGQVNLSSLRPQRSSSPCIYPSPRPQRLQRLALG